MNQEALFPAFLEPVTVALDIDRRTVVKDPVQDCSGDHMVAEDLPPFAV
jgi:hypothetical protein